MMGNVAIWGLRVAGGLALLIGLLLAIIQVAAFQKVGSGDGAEFVGPHPYVWAALFFVVGLVVCAACMAGAAYLRRRPDWRR